MEGSEDQSNLQTVLVLFLTLWLLQSCINPKSSLESQVTVMLKDYEHKVIREEKTTVILIDLHPMVDKPEHRFVMITLVFTVDNKHPNKILDTQIAGYRGLSNSEIKRAIDLVGLFNKRSRLFETDFFINGIECESVASEVVDIIKDVKDFLTKVNWPTDVCCFCQFEYDSKDDIVKTDCLHYFHCECLKGYVKYSNPDDKEAREFQCPLCQSESHFEFQSNKPYQFKVPLKKQQADIDRSLPIMFSPHAPAGGTWQDGWDAYMRVIASVSAKVGY